MHIYKTLTWIFVILLLASCATVKQQPAPQNKTIPVDNRVTTLSNIENWDLDAMIAIRNNAKNDAGSASMKWQQVRNNYNISLFGPLGTNSVKLTGRPGRVTMETANGQRSNAATPEMLLTEKTGWNIPVSSLYYWVRGIPVPNMPAQKKYDNYNHLISLQQQGWRIQYLNYTNVKQIDMPTKIFLSDSNLSVKIIINQWQI